MDNLVVAALLFVLFLLWAIIWPHVKLARQAARLAELERRVATTERALTFALEAAAQPVAPAEARFEEARFEEAAEAEAARPAPETLEEATPAPDADVADWRTHWPSAGAAVPAPSQSFEERLGAKWSVLVGGAALAIGALLLVRFSFEAGLLGPRARVVGGVLLGLALLAAGEWTRRRETPALGRVSIPATLTAAGAVAIFAAIFAAHALYGFIGAPTAFALLGATGVGTMAAAALHRPMLAGLGLIGSFATPVLVHSNTPSPWSLAVYLLIVTASAYGVARMQRSFALAVAALAGATIWQTLIGLDGRPSFQTSGVALGLLQTVMALGVFLRPYIGVATSFGAARSATLAPLAIGAATLATVVMSVPGETMTARLVGGVALVTLLAAGGALANVAAPLIAAAGTFALAIAALWPQAASLERTEPWRLLLIPPENSFSFILFAVLAGGAVAGVAFAKLRRFGAGALPAAIYGATAAATPTLLLAIAYARMTGLDVSGGFAMAAGALGVAFALAAASFRPQADALFEARQGLGFAALGALGSLAVGLAAGLSGGSLTVAWALTALAAAALAERLDVAALRWGVTAMGALVAARLAWEPRVLRELATTPIFNGLLIGYGVPALAFAGAARLLRGREDVPLQVARGLSIALAGFLVFFQIRHAMNGGDIYARRHDLVEAGLQAFGATMFAIVLTKIGGAAPPAIYRWATMIAGALAAGVAALGLLIVDNPIFSNAPLTRAGLINELIPGYLLPAAAAAGLAVVARPYSELKTRIAAAAALALVFVFVTLETRAQFHALDLNIRHGVTQGESLTFSAVWLALGFATLGYGVARRSKEARLGSAAFVLLATGKVFLFDMADLTGAWRAFSFIGLGLALIGIGAVYQRVLFPRRPAPEADGTPEAGV